VEQAAHHGALGAVDALGDLLVGHALKLAHDDDLAVLLGQTVDPLVERGAKLARLEGGRGLERRAPRRRRTTLGRLVQALLARATLLATLVDADVDDDPVQPGKGGRATLEALGGAHHLDERVVHGVERFVLVLEDGPCERVDLAMVPTVKRLDVELVAVLVPNHARMTYQVSCRPHFLKSLGF